MKRSFSLLLFAALAAGCYCCSALLADDRGTAPAQAALDTITAEELLKHTTVLASDEFEGRGPGSKGEELSVQYITEQFKKLGLQPGNPDGTYIQEVPLAGIRSFPTASFTVAGKEPMAVKFPSDYVATSARLLPEVKVDKSDIVFVGYGVVAPEYGWDDYKDVDVRGKTILMLINDPPVPDPKDPTKLDDAMFKGKAMTYYGRWSYKYEIAAQKGAAAAVIVHETEPAAYPYSVVEMSWARENFEIDAADKNMGAVPVRSWITLDTAKKLLGASGLDFDTLKKQAVSRDYKPVALPGAQASFDIKQRVRPFKSRNVVAKIDGGDPKLKDEWLLYSAHWDHLGKHPELQGDQIFNGAVDNASGVAALLALANAQTHLPTPTKRSVLFIATTAEESGLLGAKYYAEHPLHPLTKTLADINIDVVNVWGKTRDVEDVSWGNSTLDDMLVATAAHDGREAKPNSQPEKGGFYRADHFEFSKLGLPSLYIGGGREVIGKPPGFGQEKRDDFIAHHYHQPSDEVDPAWDLSGAAQDVQLLFRIGCDVANGDRFPEWKPGTEFKAKRDAMMAGK